MTKEQKQKRIDEMKVIWFDLSRRGAAIQNEMRKLDAQIAQLEAQPVQEKGKQDNPKAKKK